MAKGDREIFKADTEDGYTKIADLLLEALAMAKLNGVQKGICLFLWRRTYGWDQKKDQISLKEFAQACDTSEPYISRQLKQLIQWKVITRTSYEPGKVPGYTFNTRVAQWDKGCINVQGLSECIIQGLYICARVNQESALEPQGIEPPLYTDYKHNNDLNNNDHDKAHESDLSTGLPKELSTGKDDPGSRELFTVFEKEFGRPLSPIEFEQINQWVGEHSELLVREALKRAVLLGKYNLKYINSILVEWKKNNIQTIQAVQNYDAEFEKRKVQARSRDGPKKGQARAPDLSEMKEKEFIRGLYRKGPRDTDKEKKKEFIKTLYV